MAKPRVLSFPFKLSPAGNALTIEQGSDKYYAQQIATVLLTHQGERTASPEFGMPEQAFEGFMYSSFHNQITEYLPDISSIKVNINGSDSETQTVSVDFESGVQDANKS